MHVNNELGTVQPISEIADGLKDLMFFSTLMLPKVIKILTDLPMTE